MSVTVVHLISSVIEKFRGARVSAAVQIFVWLYNSIILLIQNENIGHIIGGSLCPNLPKYGYIRN